MAKSTQAWTELCQTALAAACANTCPHKARALRGTCFSSLTFAEQTASKEGKLPKEAAPMARVLAASLCFGAQLGHFPLKRWVMTLPQTEHEHSL